MFCVDFIRNFNCKWKYVKTISKLSLRTWFLISPLQNWALQILRISIWFDYWFIQNCECTRFRFYFVRGYFRWSPISFSFCLLSLPPSLTEILLFENLIKDYHFYQTKADAKQSSHIFQYCYRQINVFCTWIKKQKGSSDFERRYVSGKNGNSCVLGLY